MKARISIKYTDPVSVSISLDYKDSDKQAIIEEMVKRRVDWPNVQMSFGEFFRRAMEEGVLPGDALRSIADEMVPFPIEFEGPESVLALAQL